MTHTVCGSPVVMERVEIDDDLAVMVPYCKACYRHVEAIEELAADPPRVSPGRPWEVDEDA